MTFHPDAIAALKAPLDPKSVASRQQGGSQVQYIEGWHAIAEANRIFGFDGWNRETVDLQQLGEPYDNKNGNKVVNYRAKVLIVVLDENGIGSVKREGCGFGQGIDRDLGQAHESAIKEAETDAMKRAFMTFGNPFGLALYDKSRANVQAPKPPTITEDQRTELMALLDAANMPVAAVLKKASEKFGFAIPDLRELPASELPDITAAATRRADQSKQKEAA